jgi:hypothetical protein
LHDDAPSCLAALILIQNAETKLNTAVERSKQFVNPSFLVDSFMKSSYAAGTVWETKALEVLV